MGFSKALDLGVDRLELDVGITRDKVVIVHHDLALNPDLTRHCSGHWIENECLEICDLSYEELSHYDVGTIKPGSDYKRQFRQQASCDHAQIPTLAQVVSLLEKHDHQATLCIEAKYSPQHSQSSLPLEDFVETLAGEISRLGISSTAVVQAFDWQFIDAIKTRLANIQVWHLTSQLPSFHTLDQSLNGLWTKGMLLSEYSGSIPRMVAAAGGEVWNCDFQSLTEDSVAQARCLGLKTYAWTVNTEADFQMLFDLGVNGIITDYPDRLINFLEKQM